MTTTRFVFLAILLASALFFCDFSTAQVRRVESIKLREKIDYSSLPKAEEQIRRLHEQSLLIESDKLIVKTVGVDDLQVIALPQGADLPRAIRQLSGRADVEYVQPVFKHRVPETITVPFLEPGRRIAPAVSDGSVPKGNMDIKTCRTVSYGKTCTVEASWKFEGLDSVKVYINFVLWAWTGPEGNGQIVVPSGYYLFELYGIKDGVQSAKPLASEIIFVGFGVAGQLSLRITGHNLPAGKAMVSASWTSELTRSVRVFIGQTLWVEAQPNWSHEIELKYGKYRFSLFEYLGENRLGELLDVKDIEVGILPTDYYFKYQVFLKMADIGAVYKKIGWENLGRNVKIGIVDSGLIWRDIDDDQGRPIAKKHPDLANNIIPRYDATDDDYDPGPNLASPKLDGHGTFVAAILAAQINDRGGVGIAPHAEYFIYRVFNEKGEGDTVGLLRALSVAAQDKLDIINLSLSANYVEDSILRAMISRMTAENKNLIIVAASGNQNSRVDFPAAWPEVVAVGALDFDGKRSGYSNYGPELDIAAIVGDVKRPEWINHGVIAEGFSDSQVYYKMHLLNGTSFAAPQVVGALAILRSRGLDSQSALRLIFENTEDVMVPGQDIYSGRGMLKFLVN